VLDQNEQAEVVETDQDVATEPEERPVAAEPDEVASETATPAAEIDEEEVVEEEIVAEEIVAEEIVEEVAAEIASVNQQDGLGALVRAVEVAEAELAGEDAAAQAAADGDAVAAVLGVESEVEVEVDVEVAAEVDAGGEVLAEVEVVAETVKVAPAPVAPVEDDGKNWYVIHTYSGYERKVKQSLEERVRTLGLEEEVAELLIPTEDVVEMKGGRKVVTAKKFFPGYLLIRMEMNEDLWHVVKNTPRVTGFVGAGRKPIPLPQDEVDKIVNRMEESVEAPKPKFQFSKNETVRIIDGPFTNFTGKVEEVDARRSTLKVMVSIFGRNTPVELDFFQVEKV
jgi:transcriptional antiterminator NusG